MNSPTTRDAYMKQNFEISIFFNTDYMKTSSFEHNTQIKNRVARVHNTLVRAMRTRGTLPKFILLILEDDIINFLNFNDYGVSEMQGRVIEFLVKEINASIESFKGFLPNKAKKQRYPQLIWLQPSLHKNYYNTGLRKKFGTNMNNIVPIYSNNTVLRLKQFWDSENSNLVCTHRSRLSAQGHRTFWQAVDRTMRFADFKLFKEAEFVVCQEQANLDIEFTAARRQHQARLGERNNNGFDSPRGRRGGRAQNSRCRGNTNRRQTCRVPPWKSSCKKRDE